MSEPYDAELRAAAARAAREAGVVLDVGVYAGVLGPSYETPAEVRALERLGADAVGMSLVPEVVAARALGLRCAGLCVITNMATGLTGDRLAHDEVVEVAGDAVEQVAIVLNGILREVG